MHVMVQNIIIWTLIIIYIFYVICTLYWYTFVPHKCICIQHVPAISKEAGQIVCGYTTYQFTNATGYKHILTNIYLFSQILTCSDFQSRCIIWLEPVKGCILYHVLHWCQFTIERMQRTAQPTQVLIGRTKTIGCKDTAQRNRTSKWFLIQSDVVNVSKSYNVMYTKACSRCDWINTRNRNIKIYRTDVLVYTLDTDYECIWYIYTQPYTHHIDKRYKNILYSPLFIRQLYYHPQLLARRMAQMA